MKRKDAIKKAAELFEEHSNNQQYKGYSHEGLAETFLDIFEKQIGMVPPPDLSVGDSTLGKPCQWEYDGEYHE